MLLLLFSAGLFAQGSYLLTGVVSDGENEPLIGVSVLVTGTSTGTVTDFDGSYTINVSEGNVLTFSYTGYTTQSVTVTGQKTQDVTMQEGALLDEVVVVGYGYRKKSHNTGAISQLEGEEIAGIQASRVDEALAGKLAGVLIQNQDGAPGADPKIQIRAANSISGDSNPLIVVDGYPISGSLATVNPNDIQSLEILKDAASAAIYGSRGANGVVLVTTKQGKTGKPRFSYDGYVSTSSRYVSDVDQLKTAGEWADILEQGIADGTYDVSELEPEFVDYKINAYRNAPDVTAVEDYLFRGGNTQSHNFSMSGGSEDVNYFASVGYQDTKGVVITQGFERYNTRLNVNANLGERFKTGISFNGFISDRDIVGHDMRDLLRAYSIHPIYHTQASIDFVQNLDQQAQALGLDPFDNGYRGGDAPFVNSIYDLQPGDFANDWHYGRSGNGIGGSGDSGPATKLDNTEAYQKTFFGNFNSFLAFEVAEGLELRTVLGGDMRTTEDFFSRELEFDARARDSQTRLQQTNLRRSSVLSETTLNYNKVLGGVHDIGAVAGLEFQTFFNNGIALDGRNVPFGQPLNFALLDPASVATREIDQTITRRSVFGRINYAYDNRYLASFSLRRDGDSRFGINNQYGVFPAASLGWNVHNEAFFNSDFLTGLKLRFSLGSLGTTSFLGAYDAQSLLTPTASINGTAFLIPANIANPNLTWQSNTETNYGIDLGFVESRLTLGVDYYTSDIEDILIRQPTSEVFGTTSKIINGGDVTSSGLELELGAAVISTPDLRFTIGGNLSTVNTEITDLGDLDELPQVIYGQSGRGPVFRNYVGGEIGEMWGLETAGMVETEFIKDPTRAIGISSSEYYVVDQNGDGVIDRTRTVEEGGDLVKIGQNTPDFYYGFSANLNYKSFDVSMQFQGAQGGDVFNIDEIYWRSEFGGRLRDSFDADEDGIADHNGMFYTQSRNQLDAQIQDASYLALRNLTIGYTLDPQLVSKAGLGSARLYLAASNLLYLMGDDYTSLNPEGVETGNSGYLGPTTYGVQVGASPVVRSFTFGMNINF